MHTPRRDNPTNSSLQASERDDIALVRRCLAGDQQAWSSLVDQYERLVFSIPRRMGLGREAADDVFQEVFASLVRQLPKLRDPEALPKWLITTAHRLSIRQLKLEQSHAVPDRHREGQVNPVERVLQWERRRLIDMSLLQLDDRCRELLQALFSGADRPNYEQIASQFDMPVGSIGPTRARCLRKLCEIISGSEKDVTTPASGLDGLDVSGRSQRRPSREP